MSEKHDYDPANVFSIDGRRVPFKAGQTILQAALDAWEAEHMDAPKVTKFPVQDVA